MAQNSTGQVLDKDIRTLVTILTPLASRCSVLGLQLGLEDWQIKNIEKNHSKCEAQLQEILVEVLKQEEPLTWRDLVTALRSDSVGEHRLARKIESHYSTLLSTPQQQTPNVSLGTCPLSSSQFPSQQYQSPTSLPYPCFPPPSQYGQPSQLASSSLPPPPPLAFQHGNPQPPEPYTSQQQHLPHVPQQSIPQHSNQGPFFPYPHQLPPSNLPHQHPPTYPHYPPYNIPPPHHPHQYPTQYVPHPPTDLPYPSPHHSIPPTYPYYPPPYPPVHYGPPPQVASSVASTHDVPETGAPAAKRPREQSPVRPHPQPHSLPSQQLSTSQSKPDRSSLVSQYIDYVRTIYKFSEVEKDSRSLKWPPTPSKVYINLMCIDRKKVGHKNEYDEVTKAMVERGDVDVVHGKKWPIDFKEIAAGVPDIGLTRFVLVEGAPGVGKSTFAWEYCRRWERGEIAEQYQLVLLLRLRDERMSKAKTLRDLIYHPSEDVCHAVITHLEFSHGANTLVILEGFDELPDSLRTSYSIFLQLINGELLPRATVIVTSRRWATHMFLDSYSHRIFQHLEILGFTNEQISEYIESVLPESEAKDLESYIKTHPQIRGCMYIPLNCAIVVTVYQERQASGCPLPTTLTELYTALAQILLIRYLRGNPKLERDSSQHTIRIFKDLKIPHKIKRNFAELCKLAYDGIVGEIDEKCNDEIQLIFKESDLPADFDNLGFMDSVTELYVTRGTVSSHNFLHLTFQEFFAAVHISTMSPAEQLQHFQRCEDGRLKEVLRFLAGITKLSCFSGEGVQHTFLATPQPKTSKYSLNCDIAVDSKVVNWMFEAQSNDVIALLNLKEYTIKFEMLEGELLTVEFVFDEEMLPMDYYSLGYCIAHSQCQWMLDMTEVKTIDEEMLVAGASCRSDTSGRVVGIRCACENDEVGGLLFSIIDITNILIGLTKILHLHELSLKLSVQCSDISWPDLSSLRVLQLSITSQIKKLALDILLPSLTLDARFCHLNEGPPSHEYHVAIGHYIRTAATLKELSLWDINLNKEGTEVIARALASSPLSLERLKLKGKYSFTDTAADCLAQFITNSTTLQCLSLYGCQFRVSGQLALAQALHHKIAAATFKELSLKQIYMCEEEMEVIARALASRPLSLEGLVLVGEYLFTDTAADCLAQFITNSTTLQYLSLCYCTFKVGGLHALAQALHHTSAEKNVRRLDVILNDGRSRDDVEKVLCAYPDMRNHVYIQHFSIVRPIN